MVVKYYDEAIAFYTKKLDFDLIEGTRLSEVKRWFLVAPKGAKECCPLLAKAANEDQAKRIRNQTGGRVFLFLFTDYFLARLQEGEGPGYHIRSIAKRGGSWVGRGL